MCTLEKRGNIFILTLTGSGEHRLNPSLLDAIESALHQIRAENSAPSALVTTSEGKFFSNGYDLAWAKSAGPESSGDRLRLMSSKLKSLVANLVSLPMPTIAAVTGHASAGGYILALSHDYILMRKDRGFLYMSELDIDLVIPPWFMAVVHCKIGSPIARRDVVLRAKKLTAREAVEYGVIDSAHDSAGETVAAAIRFGEELTRRKWDGNVYGEIRMRLLSEVLAATGLEDTEEQVNTTRSRL